MISCSRCLFCRGILWGELEMSYNMNIKGQLGHYGNKLNLLLLCVLEIC